MWWARGQRPARRQLAVLAAPVALGAVLAGAARRLGPLSAVLVPLILAVVERAGRTDGPEDPRSPVVASAAIGVLCGSWWVGVLAGFAGELAHVKHEHA